MSILGYKNFQISMCMVIWRWKWWFFPQVIDAEQTVRFFSFEKPSQINLIHLSIHVFC